MQCPAVTPSCGMLLISSVIGRHCSLHLQPDSMCVGCVNTKPAWTYMTIILHHLIWGNGTHPAKPKEVGTQCAHVYLLHL